MNIWKHLWGVVTPDRKKASALMERIERERNIGVYSRTDCANDMTVRFVDGVSLKWIRPSEPVRGFRIGRMWCDTNVDQNAMDNVVLPKYRGKAEDIVWF